MLNPFTNPLAAVVTLYSFVEDRVKREEKGATAVEYGLLVGLIAVAIIATLLLVGPQLKELFQSVVDGLTKANAAS
ncbi:MULTISPECIES: Flp family type IVb pilin [unclassified Geodermatophilus]